MAKLTSSKFTPKLVFFAFSTLSIHSLSAITVAIDYTYDSNNFFGNADAQTAIEAAADYYESIIVGGNVGAIDPTGGNTWTIEFTNPGTGALQTVVDLVVPEDEIRIYVGGRSLGGGALGEAGRTGIMTNFLGALRGDSASSYGLWAGNAVFDTGTNWHFGVDTSPSMSQFDFYSVAVHELGHVFGLSTSSDAWNDHWSAGGSVGLDGAFNGANALAAYNADNGLSASFVPTVTVDAQNPENRHFKDGIQSKIFGQEILQDVALDPSVANGEKKLLTNVDVGALQDIGWQVVPEPSTTALLAFAAVAGLGVRRRK